MGNECSRCGDGNLGHNQIEVPGSRASMLISIPEVVKEASRESSVSDKAPSKSVSCRASASDDIPIMRGPPSSASVIILARGVSDSYSDDTLVVAKAKSESLSKSLSSEKNYENYSPRKAAFLCSQSDSDYKTLKAEQSVRAEASLDVGSIVVPPNESTVIDAQPSHDVHSAIHSECSLWERNDGEQVNSIMSIQSKDPKFAATVTTLSTMDDSELHVDLPEEATPQYPTIDGLCVYYMKNVNEGTFFARGYNEGNNEGNESFEGDIPVLKGIPTKRSKVPDGLMEQDQKVSLKNSTDGITERSRADRKKCAMNDLGVYKIELEILLTYCVDFVSEGVFKVGNESITMFTYNLKNGLQFPKKGEVIPYASTNYVGLVPTLNIPKKIQSGTKLGEYRDCTKVLNKMKAQYVVVSMITY